VKLGEKERGGIAGTPQEVSGAVHGIDLLEKINWYPGPKKQSLTDGNILAETSDFFGIYTVLQPFGGQRVINNWFTVWNKYSKCLEDLQEV
jgi:hypothetical protein